MVIDYCLSVPCRQALMRSRALRENGGWIPREVGLTTKSICLYYWIPSLIHSLSTSVHDDVMCVPHFIQTKRLCTSCSQ